MRDSGLKELEAELSQMRKFGKVKFGKVRIEIKKISGGTITKNLEIAAKEWGFVKHPETEIKKERAQKLIEELLQRDMIYKSELMSEKQAKKYTNYFFENFSEGASFFTNELGERSWDPLTNSVMDSGIFAIDKDKIGCFWIEDND